MASESARMAENELAHEMGLDERSIERRRQLAGLGPEDLKRIASIRDVIVPRTEELTASFFSFLSELEEAREFLRKRDLMEEARRLKTQHLVAMVGGEYGLAYAVQRVRLAQLYTRGGLEQRVFLGAFQHLVRAMGAILMRAGLSPEAGFDNFMSLGKVGFLDVGLIVDVMVAERERLIMRQQEAIRELTTPVLQIRDRLLMLPIIGMIDTHRARLVTESLLHAIRANRAKVVVMDVTGVLAVDTRVANHLLQTVAAARLMGATVIVTGLSAEVSQTLVNLGVDLAGLQTIGDLQGGIEEAERLIGYEVFHHGARVASVAANTPLRSI
jgi:rsbT co-antagonist protein RsbR